MPKNIMLSTEEMNPSNTSGSSAFLNKLWKIVNDPNTDELIQWSQGGKSFIIANQTRFCQELVPKYFKHSNMASFVRQLNMYGFRKVLSIESGGLSVDKGEMEFSHPNFVKGHQYLIESIKRKPQNPRSMPNTEMSPVLPIILSEVEKMKKSQELMEEKLIGVKKENELIWREYANIRQKFSKQQQIIQKLVQFLLAMVKSGPAQTISPKRKFNHLALEGADGASSSNSGFAMQDSGLELELANRLPPTGPIIRELTPLSRGTKRLEKVGHGPDPSGSSRGGAAAIPTSAVLHRGKASNLASGKRRKDPSPQPDAVSAFVFQENDSQIPSKASQQDQLFDPLFISESSTGLPLLHSEPVFDTLNLDETPSQNSENVIVHSPNGTVMLPLQERLQTDLDLDSELLQCVSPAVVSPNIVVNIPPQVQSPPLSSQTPVRSRGKNPGKAMAVSPGTNAALSHSGRSLVAEGKRKGKSVAAPSEQWPEASGGTSSDVAIPEHRGDFVHLVDDMQNSIESLQDLFKSGNFNVDTSTILSLFGGEDTYLPEVDPLNNTSGTEVSLYNPTLYDIPDHAGEMYGAFLRPPADEEESDAAQSLSKRPRLSIKKEVDTTDDVLSTPRPQFSPSRNGFL